MRAEIEPISDYKYCRTTALSGAELEPPRKSHHERCAVVYHNRE